MAHAETDTLPIAPTVYTTVADTYDLDRERLQETVAEAYVNAELGVSVSRSDELVYEETDLLCAIMTEPEWFQKFSHLGTPDAYGKVDGRGTEAEQYTDAVRVVSTAQVEQWVELDGADAIVTWDPRVGFLTNGGLTQREARALLRYTADESTATIAAGLEVSEAAVETLLDDALEKIDRAEELLWTVDEHLDL